MESSKETVLITGITGYTGAHVAKVVIEQSEGRFQFRASTRNLAKTAVLRNSFGDEIFNQI